MTMGLAAELPQVLAMAALKVAVSALVVLLVEPGTAVQLAVVDQLPLAVEPPFQVPLAADAGCAAINARAIKATRPSVHLRQDSFK